MFINIFYKPESMTNCVFCERDNINSDIIYNSKNFFVKVGFALYSPGQVMLIPKNHYKCFGEIPEEIEEEKRRLEDILMKKISQNFSEPLQIEMGVWGQSVNHAHIHFVPSRSSFPGSSYEVNDLLQEMILSGGDEKISYEIGDIPTLKRKYKKEGGYVSIKQFGKLYFCSVKNIPFDSRKLHPQLTLRGFFTNVKKLQGVSNWREMSEEERITDEKKRELTKSKLIF